MTKRIILILLFFLGGSEITCFAQAPSWLWANKATTFGATIDVTGMGMDAQGNTYSFGYARKGIQFGNRPVLPQGLFLVKHNRQGNPVWDLAIETKSMVPISISTDSVGNSYLTGLFRDTLTIGSNKLVSYGFIDTFLAKIDSAGAVTWAQRVGGILLPAHMPPVPMVTEDMVYGLGVDAAGNSYLTGITVASDTAAAMFGSTPVPPPVSSLLPVRFSYLAKFNASGQLQWVTKGQDNSLMPNVIGISKKGQIFTAGVFTQTLNIGNDTLTSRGLNDIFLARYDGSGNFLWAKSFGGIHNDNPNALLFDKSGNLVISGSFSDTVQFGSFTLIKQSASFPRPALFLAKLDTSGNVIWASQTSGTGFAGDPDLALDAAGNSYVSCTFADNVLVGQQSFTSTGGSYDVLVSKWDSNGTPVWAVSAQGVGNDFPGGIAVDPVTSDCFIAGSFEGPLDFGSINLSAGQNSNFFLARLGRNTVGLPEAPAGKGNWLVYPNPAAHSFSVSLVNPGAGASGTFFLFSSTGKLVREIAFVNASRFEVERESLPAGLYMYKLQLEKELAKSGKIMLQ